jgi:CheY-like chemotaxis protein
VLVVDDQPQVLSVLETALRDAGASVLTAQDGAQALEIVSTDCPELILLDVYMPQMDGWQFLERLPGVKPRSEPAIVLQTSAEQYSDLQRARDLGVAAYVSKPFRLSEVVETCGRVLDGARPLLGRGARPLAATRVLVHGPDGAVGAHGDLLELTTDGAQVELDVALPTRRRHRFTLEPACNGRASIDGEVRWVRAANGRFVHGLMLKRD